MDGLRVCLSTAGPAGADFRIVLLLKVDACHDACCASSDYDRCRYAFAWSSATISSGCIGMFQRNIPFCLDGRPCRYSKEHLFVFCDRSSMDRPGLRQYVKICLTQGRQCSTHSTCFFIALYLMRQEEIIDMMCVSPADAMKGHFS